MRAMAARPEERFPDSKQFADAVGDWLEGAKKKERAYEIVARAEQMAPRSEALRCRATEARSQATALLAGVNSWDDEASKLSGWELEDQAQSMEREADLVDLEARRLYHAALTYVPQLADAHVALAQAYRADHAAAELDRDRGQAEQAELLLRSHVVALPEARPERAQLVAYLRGVGSLTLRTDPPSAEVDLFRYKQHNRRLVPVFDRSLGSTPLVDVPLAMGSYVLRLRAPGCEQVAYPVFVGRQEHWSGVAPGETEPRPVPLPGTGTVSSKECYVPPGWFRCGGDSQLEQTFPQGRVWVDGFIMQRYTVTNAEFIVFLDDLVSRGREQEALAAAPRERGGTVDEPGAVIFGRDPDGGFFLRPDADGDQWEPDCPVMMVTLHGARAYARWWSERTGHHWRIPHEIEWEKAARGVDGRFYPWGDFVDPSWACLRLSHDGRPVPATRDQFPQDQSPYGVRHLGGGSRDWCRSRFEVEVGLPPDGLLRIDEFESDCDPMDLFSVRGGWWYAGAIHARSANRQGMEAHARSFHMGIRLVRSWES
jgi:serine/threonine-protein kinase